MELAPAACADQLKLRFILGPVDLTASKASFENVNRRWGGDVPEVQSAIQTIMAANTTNMISKKIRCMCDLPGFLSAIKFIYSRRRNAGLAIGDCYGQR